MQVNYTNAQVYNKLKLKTLVVWLAIMLVASFAFSANSLKDPVNMGVMPEVPKQGEPLIVSFALNNPGLTEETYAYELYVNGKMVMSGESAISPLGSEQHRYAYKNPLELGEQTNFLLMVKTPSGVIQKAISTPAYAPQIWTSFVSFASFSTSVMSSMGTMAYYDGAFSTKGMNIGLVFVLVLIPLLVFSVLAEPYSSKNIFGRLKSRFGRLSTVLFVIFMGMVLTRMVMIIGRVA